MTLLHNRPSIVRNMPFDDPLNGHRFHLIRSLHVDEWPFSCPASSGARRLARRTGTNGADAADVPAIAALASDNGRCVARRFDYDAIDEIYPNIWDESDYVTDYLPGHLQELRSFYRNAAANSAAVIIRLA